MLSPAQAPPLFDEEPGIARFLTGLGPRWQGVLIAAGAAILLINVALLAWTSQQSQSQAKLASHSLMVENRLSELLLFVRTAESEQRGDILARGNSAYRASYIAALNEIPRRLAELKIMTADNLGQQAELAGLERLINDKLADLASKLRLLEEGDRGRALELFDRNDKGRALMATIKEQVARLKGEEERLLFLRSADSARASQQLFLVSLGDTLLIFFLGWMAISFSLLSSQRLSAANAALEAKVEERVAELRAAHDEMQSFAYVVGHDLRAPLVNIMGFTGELQSLRDAIFNHLAQGEDTRNGEPFDDKAAAAEFDEALGFIRAATAKIDHLINAILAISRAGKRELSLEKIDMSALVNGVAATLAHQAQAVGAKMEVGTLPPVTCDRLALEQIFANLLDNALKYLRDGEPGQIQVTGYAARDRVIYEVRDNGRGIAEADQKRVFDLFRRAGAQDQRGEGIGLANARALVRRLGGTIGLTSTLDRGSTFKVVLPRVCASQ